MIVCLCHRVSDRDIANAVAAGTVCFDSLQAQTQLGTHCGSCRECAREVFDAACARAAAAVAPCAVPSLGLA